MVLLAHDVSIAAGNLPESLAKWSAGKRIEVTLNGGDRLIGHLGTVESDRFVLAPDKLGGTQRVLRFEEVRSARGKMTTARKWAIAGGVIGFYVFMLLTVSDR